VDVDFSQMFINQRFMGDALTMACTENFKIIQHQMNVESAITY
jgi:hypothetical protein